uniref:Uncharacterized protein n=1 Tax=Cavenderia fasciculata TaxID=261658 RepID=B2XX74_CACFS|nr:hypothetical protein Difao_mp12 [Cavenderia fasciculata]ABX45196.1 hypothetical protein [Cavenderia fasciculata]
MNEKLLELFKGKGQNVSSQFFDGDSSLIVLGVIAISAVSLIIYKSLKTKTNLLADLKMYEEKQQNLAEDLYNNVIKNNRLNDIQLNDKFFEYMNELSNLSKFDQAYIDLLTKFKNRLIVLNYTDIDYENFAKIIKALEILINQLGS